MTISSTTNEISFACNGATTFPFPFKVLEAEHLRVLLKDDATSAVTVLVNTADYTIYGIGEESGGNLVTNSEYPTGYTLYLKRRPEILQKAVYTPNGPFPASSHETALDKTTMIDQMLQDQIDRCLIFDETSGVSGMSIELPVANYFLRFNSAATGIVPAIGTESYIHPNHSGDVTSVADGATAIAAGVIVNNDINANAAIALSKLATQAAETVLVNATAGAAVPTALSVPEQTLLGRITGGHIAALPAATVKVLLAITQADVTGLTTADSPAFAGLTLTADLAITGDINLTAGYEFKIDSTRALSFTGGTGNTWIGPDTGAAIQAGGTYNFAAGGGAGNALTTGDYNFFAGFEAGHLATTCVGATAMGFRAGFSNNAAGNIFIGLGAGYNNTTGVGIIAVGNYSLYTTKTNDYLIAIGSNALYAVDGGYEDIAIGAESLKGLTTGAYNIGIGSFTGYALTTQNANICIGRYVMRYMTGVGNIGIGQATFDGPGASGSYNVAIGYTTASGTIVSSYNIIMGYVAGVALGTSDGYNVMIGSYSGYTASTNARCVFLGPYSGYYETGSNKLFIDNAQRASEADGRVKALVYGEFNAATASQLLRINGKTELNEDITIASGKNIVLNTSTGTKIGTATSQLLGFYNATPVNQPDTVSDPSGGAVVDAEARSAINAIIDRLQELGLIA